MSQAAAPTGWQLLYRSPLLRLLVIILLFGILLLPWYGAYRLLGSTESPATHLSSSLPTPIGQQMMTAPLLVIPYTEHITNVETVLDDNQESTVRTRDIFTDHTAVILPNVLDIQATLSTIQASIPANNPQTAYEASITLEGRYDYGFILEATEGKRTIRWEQAFLAVGLSDPRGLTAHQGMQWGADTLMLRPNTQLHPTLPSGFHVALPAVETEERPQETIQDFRLTLQLQGQQSLFFSPLGEITTLDIRSDWPQPHFNGDLLPDEQEQSASGFTAHWEVDNLVRNFPQYWQLDQASAYQPDQFKLGATLAPQKTFQTTQLSLLQASLVLIALLFISYFTFELWREQRLYLLQFMVAACLTLLFNVALHALQPYVAWPASYIIAAAGTSLLLWLYSWAIWRNVINGLLIALLSGAFYAITYSLLQQPAYQGLAICSVLALAILLLTLASARLVQPFT